MRALSLTQKLLVATLLPVFIVFAGLTYEITSKLKKNVPPMIEASTQQHVEARGDEIGQWIEGYSKWLKALSQDALLSLNTNDYVYGDWLAARHPGDEAIETLFFARKNGDAITYTGDSVNIGERQYFKDLVTEGTKESLLSDPVISKVSGDPAAVIGQVIYNSRGERIGMLGMTLTMEHLSRISNQLGGEDDESYGWVTDSTGMLVAHPAPEARMKINVTDADKHGYTGLDDFGKQFIKGEAGQGDILNLDGESVRMTWAPIPNTPNWTVGVSIPVKSFTATSDALFWEVIIIAAVSLGSLFVIILVTTRKTLSPIGRTADAMREIAEGEGDLTQRLECNTQDEVGDLARQFNAFAERMEQTLIQVRESTLSVVDGAGHISRHTEELASRTEQSAANLQETSSAMEEITATVGHTSQNTQQATHLSEHAAQTATEGSEAMSEVGRIMEAINTSSQEVNDIVTLIDGIAFQTNILALNASVEAARAGEHGRGFAVVAEEVRRLASRSSEASKEIRALIDTSVLHTEEGNKSVAVASEKMTSILENVTRVNDVLQEINSGVTEQTSGIEQINKAISELDSMTQQNTGMVNESATYARQMESNALELDGQIRLFKLGKASAGRSQVNPAGSKALLAPTTDQQEEQGKQEDDWATF